MHHLMTIGTEHEYSINDREFHALPDSDRILKTICGRYESEIRFGEVMLGKELQKTVLEMVPRQPADELAVLEAQLVEGMSKFNHLFADRYQLLGLGMHPLAKVHEIPVWDHDEGEYYGVYDRLFDIRQHGWLNIQALQVNLSYESSRNLVHLYNKIGSLLPYLVAVTASSPMVEGVLTGTCDNRLVYYRENQKEIPQICNRIIPEGIQSITDYRNQQEEIFSDLRARGAEILCEEWVNSSGVIIRFSRRCVEIKALDEQESIHSDMAVSAFIRSLLRCRALPVERDYDVLLELTEEAIRHGTGGMRDDLLRLYEQAWQHATGDERCYLPVIKDRITHGSLAEQIRDRVADGGEIMPTLSELAACLRENRSYGLHG